MMKKHKKPDALERFTKETASHKMQVLLDSGTYRHLIFRSDKDSWCNWFEIVTWPGSLIINGDMGSYSFSRIEDMFGFFRNSKDEELKINPSYWEEKIQAQDRRTPAKRFDIDYYRENVLDSLNGYWLDGEGGERREQITAALQDVFHGSDDMQPHEIYEAVREFEHDGFSLSDPWEISSETYTFHYLWCLYAIVWGIRQYDAAKQIEPERAA